MNRLTSLKTLAAAAVALGAFGAATAAHARSDVFFTIGLPGPAYVQPAPVYVQPSQYYVQPAPVYERRGAWGDRDHDGVPNAYDRYDNRYRHNPHYRNANLYGPYGDLDRDGVPNRFDRAPQNPYRR
jgi:hypothetical protein